MISYPWTIGPLNKKKTLGKTSVPRRTCAYFCTCICICICDWKEGWGWRVVRWCWVNFQCGCRGVLLIWLVVLGLTALWDNILVYIGPSPKEREKEEKGQMWVKMSKPPPPAPTASAIGPYPTVIKIVGRPGTGSLPITIAPPDHPLLIWIIVGQGPTVLAVNAGGYCLTFFSPLSFSLLSPSLLETARYRLKNCLKGPFNPVQPTTNLEGGRKTTLWQYQVFECDGFWPDVIVVYNVQLTQVTLNNDQSSRLHYSCSNRWLVM